MALCEYGCRTLDYVYDMTWAEFRIRQYSYNREQKNEWFKIREIAYASIIGPHLDHEKVPSKEKYMPLGDKEIDTERIKKKILEAVEIYKKEKNGES